jgi:hypothetical protein
MKIRYLIFTVLASFIFYCSVVTLHSIQTYPILKVNGEVVNMALVLKQDLPPGG